MPTNPTNTAITLFLDGTVRVRIAAASTVVTGMEPLIIPVTDEATDFSASGYR